jgi:hypothetical protein
MHRKKHLVFDRIINTLTDKNISIPCFQKRIGVISQNWTNWRNRGVPTKEYERIALELDLNLEWLITGNGAQYCKDKPNPNCLDITGLTLDQRTLLIQIMNQFQQGNAHQNNYLRDLDNIKINCVIHNGYGESCVAPPQENTQVSTLLFEKERKTSNA